MLTEEQKDKIVFLLSNTNQTYVGIGKQFGVTRQYIGLLCKANKIKRPTVMVGGHRLDRCSVCQDIIDRANKGVVCTTRQLAELLGISYFSLIPHMILLRKHNIIPKEFCFFRSDKVVEAVKLFKENDISARQAGIQLGVVNFSGVLWRARQRGLSIQGGKQAVG
jgi:hypothetical protein